MTEVQDVINHLEQGPQKIQQQADVVEAKELNFRMQKHKVDILRAQAYLQTSGSIPEREAKVKLDQDVRLGEVELIKREGSFREEKILLDRYDNEFNAYRKIANLKETMIKNLGE